MAITNTAATVPGVLVPSFVGALIHEEVRYATDSAPAIHGADLPIVHIDVLTIKATRWPTLRRGLL